MKRWLKNISFLCIAAATFCSPLQSVGHTQEFDFNVIATTGGKVPGGLGTYKKDVLGLSVSDAGVAFTYLITKPKGEESRVLVFNDGESSNLVLQTGSKAPCDFAGKIDGMVTHIATPVMNDNGQIAFYGVGQGGELRPTGAIFRVESNGEGLASLLRGNCSSSDYPRNPDALFDRDEVPEGLRLRSPPVFTVAVMNESGQVPFDTILPNVFNKDDVPSPSYQNAALFISDGTKAGATTLAQRSQIPVGIEGVTKPLFSSAFVAIDIMDSGEVLFSADLEGVDSETEAALTEDTNSILATTADGKNFKLIFREGTELPGREGYFGPAQPLRLEINNKGQVVFYSGELSETDGGNEDDAGIFVWDPKGATQELVAKNAFVDPANEAEGRFTEFSEFSGLTDSGLFAFYAEIKDTEEGGRGLFVGDINAQTFTEIIRAGDPGGTKGTITNFPETGAAYSINKDSREFAINESGQLYFLADVDVDDGPGFALEETLFFHSPDQGLVQVLRKGAPFAGGVLKKLKFEHDYLDNNGRCVIKFELVDGTLGIAFVQPNAGDAKPNAGK